MRNYFSQPINVSIFILIIWSEGVLAISPREDKEYRKLEFSIPMKDGTLLATDVYLPESKTSVPVVLVRTPYNKDGVKGVVGKYLAKNIAVVSQDCRGRFKSGGEFYPFRNEREDGLSTLKWIRAQTWSNGKIGAWGGSYVGYTQWAISDSLDVLTPVLTSADIYGLLYTDSLFALQTAFSWGLDISAKGAKDKIIKGIQAAYSILPISSADDSISYNVQFINDWFEHEKHDDYWQAMDHGGITGSPVLSLAGWYDIFLKQQLTDFRILEQRGKTNNRLIVGPWCHGSQGYKNEYGGSKSTGNREDIIGNFLMKYLQDSLQPISVQPFPDKKYSLFIMERNEYFGSDTWPPGESKSISYFLGKNNYLSSKSYPETGKLYYTYSPDNPYPSLGGTGLSKNVGPALQNANKDRKDQLIFETEKLNAPLTLLGDLSAILYVSSDVQCTDFIVCLQDVFPNGDIINIQEGGTRVRFSGSEIVKKEISVWATGYELKTGHQLRVVITSSWFPRFNRSLNTCEPAFSAKELKPANQAVYFGKDTPSHIILPILIDR